MNKIELKKELRKIIDKELFESERWITQRKEDMTLKPSGCAYCGSIDLVENSQGWSCRECGQEINAVSYYQGANAKAKTLK